MPIQALPKKLLPPKPLPLPVVALRAVTSKTGKGVYASSDTLFKGAVFGRDSIEVAEDLLRLRPRLAKRIIYTLAKLQGEERNDRTEEEPGKIIHEYRTLVVDGKMIKGVSRHIFDELSERWGGNGTSLAYFGSIDATPHFVRLVGRYCDLHGGDILEQKIKLRSGHKITLRLVVENAIDWLLKNLKESRSGLVEYQRRNAHGIENQVWKDSKEFYVHENGVLCNHDAPIASIEVQGLAYDALMWATLILPNRHEYYLQAAYELQAKTFELLWDEKRQYWALGLDYDKQGQQRIISTLTANPAALLDTMIFDDLPEPKRQEYICGIVRMIMSREFLTDAGIRSRALSEAHLIEYWDYHGSYVSWPKETYDIAKGLRRQGFPKLARELDNRVLNLVRRSRSYLEFVYVDEWGRVLASAPNATEHGDVIIVDSTNRPETIQAWTVSAIMAILANKIAKRMGRTAKVDQEPWQIELEKTIMKAIPATPVYLDRRTLKARYPSYPYRLEKGKSHKSTDMPSR
jgi:glycogen debranching enzyme